MGIDFSKLKKHEKYKEGNVQTQTITQRVQARYENIMQQTTGMTGQTRENSMRTNMINRANETGKQFKTTIQKQSETKKMQNNIPKVTTNQQMNTNTGTGIRSTAKTSNVNAGKLPTLNGTKNNKEVLPKKYEENKKAVDNKKWYQKILKKPEILEDNLKYLQDGYDVGDITKTYQETKQDITKIGAGTVTDLGLGVVKGVVGIGEGVGKAISGGVAQVADWTGHDEYAKMVRNRLAGREKGAFDEKYLPTNLVSSAQEKVDKASMAGEYADKASENVGYMAGLMALNSVAPGSGTPAMFLNSSGNALAEAYAKDENVEDWQAWTKAIGSGTFETVIEKSSGLLGGKGIGEKMTGKIANQISSGAGKSLSKLLGVAADESIEEFKSYVANYGLDRFIDSVSKITGSDIKFSEDWNWNEVGEAMGLAFASTLLMSGGSVNANIKAENSLARNELIDSSNLGENSKEQLKRLSEKNNWTVENLKNMLEEGGNLNNQKVIQNKADILPNNELLQNNQQITQEQNKTPQNGNMEQIDQVKIDSENFAKQVDNVQNIKENNDLTVLNQTPQVYKDLGINDLPMTITKNHTIWAIQEKSKKNSHLHGIDKEIIKQIPEALTRPLNIVQSGSRTDSIVAITELADSEGNLIVVPVRVNGKSNVNEIEIDANVLTSIYGKDNNYDRWMKKNIENGRVLYDIDEGIIKKYRDNPPRLQLPNDITPEVTRSGLQLPRTSNSVDTVDNVSTLNNIIPQNENKMQVQNQKSNNVKNSNESSFYLPPTVEDKLPKLEDKTMPLKMESEEAIMKINIDDDIKLPQKEKTKLPERKDDDLQAIREASEKGLGDTLSIDEQLEAIQNLDTKELDTRLPDTSNMIVNKLKREKTTFKEFTTMIRKLVTNQGAGVDDLFKATGNKQGTWKYDRYLGSFSEGQTSIGINQVNAQGQVVGDALLTIYDKAKKDGITQKILDDYVLNKDNIARSNYEKGLYGENITAKDSERIIDEYDKKYPKLKDYAKQVSDFGNHNTESYLVGNFISQDLYDHIRAMYPDHVPVVRDIADTPGMKEYDNVGTQVLKKATGGDEAILSPKEALAQQSISYAKAYRRNEALKEVYKSIKSDTKVLYDLGQIVDIEQANLEIQNAVGYDENLKKYTATIFENGAAKVFEISKDIYDAFTPSEAMTKFEDTIDKLVIGKVLKITSSGFKSLTTGKNILYALKNMVRDINDAPINSTTNFVNYMKDWGYAYEQIVTNGKYYKEYINSGGSANTFYDYNKGLLKSDYSSLPKKAIDFINDVTIGSVETINEVVETAPRLAEYIATRQRGGSIDEALYNASEVTTNFKRGGSLTKLVDKYGVPYINASVQGLSKVYRNVSEAKGFGQCAKLIINSAVAGVLPSLINHLIYQDDDDYEQLEDYLKDGYYLIKVDDLPENLQNTLGRWTENNFVRIPKGRISAVLGDTAVKLYETTQGNTDTWKGYMNDVVLNNIGINNPITNNLFSGLVQAMDNEAWYGGSIYSETKYDGMLPVEITDEKTDNLSNWVAETLYNMVGEEKYKELVDKDNGNAFFRVLATPKLLNYVMDQYSGFIGDIVLPKLTPYAENNAFVDQFTTSSTLKSSVVSEFYEIIDNCYENSVYATDMDKLTSKYLGEVSKDVGSLYADKASIQSDNSLTDRQKQQKTYEIQEQINQKMQEAINKVKSAKISNNTADFDGTEYYKDEEGKWKEVTDKNKIEGLSTETYADYKNKTAEALASKKRKEGDDTTLTTKERLNILTNSTYTDKEKDAIYTQTTGKNDETYSNLKLINGNDLSKIDDYLNYKTADIKADEDTSSNVKDATISGSKKKNVITYINNSNFDGFEKLYLYGKSYKLNSSEQKQFDNYMKTSNLTAEEKKKIYLDMSGVEELKDGSIRWK